MSIQLNQNNICHNHYKDPAFQGLNRYLSKNFVQAGISKISGIHVSNEEAVMEVLEKFPKSRGFVGNLPPDWIDRIPKGSRKETVQQIQDLFANLAENIYSPIFTKFDRNEKFITDFTNKLQNILKLETHIDFINEGSIGKAFRLGVGNNQYVFKAFHSLICPEFWDLHGKVVEPARASFAKKHGCKSFTKFYFGKIAEMDAKNGFMVTKFEDSKRELTPQDEIKRLIRILKSPVTTPDMTINSAIMTGGNTIRRKIIDYGNLKLFNNNLKETAVQISKYYFNTRKNKKNKQMIIENINKTNEFLLEFQNTEYCISARSNMRSTLKRLSELIDSQVKPKTKLSRLTDNFTLQKPKSLFERAIGFLLPQK